MRYAWCCILCLVYCVSLVGGILGCTRAAPLPSVPESPPSALPKQLQPRQVIVTLARASPERWANIATALSQTYGLPQIGAFPLSSLGIQCLVFQLPADASVDTIVKRLVADPRVESVQLNQVFEGQQSVHNDPYAALQHGAQTIRADLAHRWATGKGVKIALVDTGVDTEHADLQGRVVQTVNFVDGGEQSFAQDGHGTAVAGVIAASANNGTGIFGIAPEADMIAIKACWHPTLRAREALCSSWTIAKAVDFAIAANAQVLNMSLAGPGDPLIARLITAAGEKGMTVVAATLEDDARAPGFPASLRGVIAAVACDVQGKIRRRAVAPGVAFLAAPGVEILTTTPGGAYDFLSGSSLAAAHVSGLAALLLEHNPRLSPAQVYDVLRATAQPAVVSGNPAPSTVGIVDACNALEKLLGIPACSAS